MAENPVLTEAKRKGLVSTGAALTRSNSAVVSSSANPVVQQFNGTTAAERAASQQKIIEAAKTAPVTTTTAQQDTDSGFDLAKFMVGTLGKGANAIAKTGSSTLAFFEKSLLEPFFPGITQSTPIQDLNKNIDQDAAYLDSKYSANTAKGGKAAKIAEDVGVGVLQAIPQAVVAVGTAGSSLAAQGLSKAAASSPTIVNTLKSGVSQAAKNLNYWTAFLSTVGNDYESAKADGADDTHAGLYAVADSLLGAAVEIGGGIQKLPTELQGNRFTVRNWINTMLDEGKEEVVQGVLSRGLENVVYNKGNAVASTTDENAIFNPKTSAKEFGLGAAVGGILGGTQGFLSNAAQNRTQDAAGAQTEAKEGNVTPTAQNAADGARNAAPEAGTAGGVKAGRVTTIKNPYRGEGPTQTARQSTAPVQVSNDSLATAQNRIDGAQGLASSMPGQSFKSSLKNAYKGVFKSATGVPVDGLTFNGKQYTVDIPNSVPGKVISDNNLTAEKLALLDNLSDVVRNGEYVGSGEYVAHGAKAKNTIRYDYFETPVEISGRPYIASFDVEVFPNTNNYRTHKLNEIELSSPTSADTGRDPAASVGRTAQFEGTRPLNVNFTIAQGAENVKMQGDVLSNILFGGKRVDLNTLTEAQQNAVYQANEAGTVGMDAKGRVFQIDPETHIDRRTTETVGNRSLNAFQFDHPQLHRYYQQAANALIADADLSQQFPMNRSYERGAQGNRVNQSAMTSQHLRRAMDETGLSRNELIDAAQRIVNDRGQENVKAAKQVEVILDDMLTNGWSPMTGESVGPNEAYIRAKADIAGSMEGAEVQREELPIRKNDGIGAANAGFDPYSQLQNQTAQFHPDGAYAARPVEVPTTNFEGRNIPKAASTIMGAQGIDESDVRFLEQQIADGKLAFDTIRDTDAVARAQTVMQEKGFDGAMEQYRQAVAGNVATKDNTALGQQLLLRAMREGNTAYVAELLTLYTRNSTTAAQAMQAQSIFRKLSPEGQLVAVQKAVADLNTKYGTDVQLSEAEVADFLNAGTPEARQEVTERIVARAAESVPGTFRAKYDTLRYLAMLGNPRTHIRNILGNTFFQVPVAIKNRVGAVAEGIAHVASGGKTERTKALFGVNPLGKLAAEARADWANAKDFLEQSSKYAEGQASLSAIERQADAFSNSNILGRGVNKAADLNSRALAAEDTAAKKWIYTQSLAGYLKANGCKSIADADLALLNRARNYAAQEALRGTFNDSNEISDAVSALGRASQSENKAVKAAGYVVEGVLPFKRTPANIAVRAVEYSPLGAVLGAVETMRGAKSGDMARVSVGLDRTAAGVSGTALLAAGFLAAGAGYVTGGEDEDEKQQAFDDLTGHQNYALELKDGTSVTLDWLAPEAIPFFMGIELHESMLDGGVSWDEAWETVKNAASPMLEMSMLQGLNDTFENAAYAKNRGDSVLGSLLTSALTNYATQIFPTLGGQIERSHEDVRMTTYTEKDGSLPTDFQYTLGKVSQKIPGWDYQQIPYIDAWGRTEATGDALERSINNLFNPAYVSQVEVDELETELQRLKDATGSGSVFPERAERSITVDGEKKNLTAEEYQQYATTLGQSSYALVKAGTSLAAYRAMNDAEKVEYVDRLYQYATQTAKASVSAYQTDTWVENARQAQTDIGVSTAEYIALYEKYGSDILSGAGYEKTKQAVAAGLTVEEYAAMKGGMDADDNGSVSQKEAQAYLDRQTFAVGVKADLWTIINKSWKNNPYA